MNYGFGELKQRTGGFSKYGSRKHNQYSRPQSDEFRPRAYSQLQIHRNHVIMSLRHGLPYTMFCQVFAFPWDYRIRVVIQVQCTATSGYEIKVREAQACRCSTPYGRTICSKSCPLCLERGPGHESPVHARLWLKLPDCCMEKCSLFTMRQANMGRSYYDVSCNNQNTCTQYTGQGWNEHARVTQVKRHRPSVQKASHFSIHLCNSGIHSSMLCVQNPRCGIGRGRREWSVLALDAVCLAFWWWKAIFLLHTAVASRKMLRDSFHVKLLRSRAFPASFRTSLIPRFGSRYLYSVASALFIAVRELQVNFNKPVCYAIMA